ncbi:LysR family transcriptional regulator [Motilimonas eburnea]|uniref:LysR family transcriptional regulator n=1 Tax=Motilimonas eburnea TaxID=1737488 RepID=UPI001E2EC7F6|nr:LysR family transcriptional regulator [Motilimonas eburnea]MCE2571130.1 LysR family transcriptional regulator [Motilimonas eburnea]
MASIDQINAFIAVYETKGYSPAAKQLNKSRTTVRELVMTLEDQLALVLFEVDGRKVIPTVDAQKLHFQAKLLQSHLASFNELVDSIHAQEEASFTILYDPMLNPALIVELTAELSQTFPRLKLDWQVDDWNSAMKKVASGEVDFAFMPNKKSSFSAIKIDVKFLGFQSYGFYTSATGLLSENAMIDKLILRQEPQVLHQNIVRNDENVEYMRISANYIAVMNNDELCRTLAKVGWGLVPHCYAKPYVDMGLIKPFTTNLLLNEYKMSIAAYYAPAITRGPVMAHVLNILPELAAKYYS